VNKIISVKRSSVFSRAYKLGKSVATKTLAVYVLKRKKDARKPTALGLTVSKKYGKAVDRSRARRVMREAYRGLCDRVIDGYDIILVARGRLLGAKTPEALADLSYALEKLDLLTKEE
jgi:ribonuclease P protein component